MSYRPFAAGCDRLMKKISNEAARLSTGGRACGSLCAHDNLTHISWPFTADQVPRGWIMVRLPHDAYLLGHEKHYDRAVEFFRAIVNVCRSMGDEHVLAHPRGFDRLDHVGVQRHSAVQADRSASGRQTAGYSDEPDGLKIRPTGKRLPTARPELVRVQSRTCIASETRLSAVVK